MKRITVLLVLSLMVMNKGMAQQSPSAAQLLKQSQKVAKAEHKKIMVIFTASWCGWCKKLKASMANDSCAAYFKKNFIVQDFVVLERKEMKQLETPGATELYYKHAGKDQGIPFVLLYDSKGKLLSTSKMPNGNNTGCPATEDEVQYFIDILNAAAPMTAEEKEHIKIVFRRNDTQH